jgi:hypothetical protein
MPQSLYYFLPRSDKPTQRLYINQTLAFMGAMGLLAAWAISAWNPFRPDAIAAIASVTFRSSRYSSSRGSSLAPRRAARRSTSA